MAANMLLHKDRSKLAACEQPVVGIPLTGLTTICCGLESFGKPQPRNGFGNTLGPWRLKVCDGPNPWSAAAQNSSNHRM